MLVMARAGIANRCPDCGNRGPWLPVVDKPGDQYPRELKCGTPDCSFTVDYRVVARLEWIRTQAARLEWIRTQAHRHPKLDEASE